MVDADRGDDVVTATYQYRASAGTDIGRLAHSLAELQSSGAWVELAGETDVIRQRHAARVVRTWEIPADAADPATAPGDRSWGIEIGYPVHNTGGQIPLLLATVFGECASWRGLKLTDLVLPESFVAGFTGPAVGLDRDPWHRRRHRPATADHDHEARDRAHSEGERGGLLPGRDRRLGCRQGRREGRLAAMEQLPRPRA